MAFVLRSSCTSFGSCMRRWNMFTNTSILTRGRLLVTTRLRYEFLSKTCKALHNSSLAWFSNLSSSHCPILVILLSYSVLWQLLQHIRPCSFGGFFHLQISLPKTFSPWLLLWQFPLSPSAIKVDVTSTEKPYLVTLPKANLLPFAIKNPFLPSQH